MPRQPTHTSIARNRVDEPRAALAVLDRSWSVALVVAVALAWRVFVLVRLRQGPLAELLETDSRIYWEWAGLLLRDGWIGTHQFFMAPLYPYALGLARLFTGDSILAVQTLQCLASSATIGLLTRVAMRLHGPRWGIGLGLLLAGYGPWLFFDVQILMEPLLLALQAMLLGLLVAQGDRTLSAGRAAWAGGLIGLMSLGRATNLLLAIPIGLWAMRQSARDRRLHRVAAMLAVAAAFAVPTSLRSWSIGREWIPYTYGLGYNAWVGNGPAATGTFISPATGMAAPVEPGYEGGALGDGRNALLDRSGRAPSPARSSDLWLARTTSEIVQAPGRWAKLIARKAVLLLNDEEASQIQSPRVYAAVAGPLGWPLAGRFGFIAVLGLVGVLAGFATAGIHRVLASIWLVLALSTIAFFVTDRYRMHLVPTTVLLAPLALGAFRGALAARRWPALVAWGLGFAVAGLVVFRPIVATSAEKVRFDVGATLASAHLGAERPADAKRELARVIAIDRAHRLPGAETGTGRRARSAVYAMHAFLAMNDGEWETAADELATARRLGPPGADDGRYLAIALAAGGRLQEARELLGREDVNRGRLRDELLWRIDDSEVRGRPAATEGYVRALNVVAPHWEPAVVALVRTLLAKGDLRGARDLLEVERRAGLHDELYRVHLAAALKLEGRTDEARRILRQVSASARRADPAVIATMQAFGLNELH